MNWIVMLFVLQSLTGGNGFAHAYKPLLVQSDRKIILRDRKSGHYLENFSNSPNSIKGKRAKIFLSSRTLWSKIEKNTDKIAIQSFSVPRARKWAKWAVRANERMDKQAAQYLSLSSCLFQTTVPQFFLCHWKKIPYSLYSTLRAKKPWLYTPVILERPFLTQERNILNHFFS